MIRVDNHVTAIGGGDIGEFLEVPVKDRVEPVTRRTAAAASLTERLRVGLMVITETVNPSATLTATVTTTCTVMQVNAMTGETETYLHRLDMILVVILDVRLERVNKTVEAAAAGDKTESGDTRAQVTHQMVAPFDHVFLELIQGR